MARRPARIAGRPPGHNTFKKSQFPYRVFEKAANAIGNPSKPFQAQPGADVAAPKREDHELLA